MTQTRDGAGREYRVISAAEAEERFGISRDVRHVDRYLTDELEIRLYEGGWHVAGDLFVSEYTEDRYSPANIIVDGELVVDGDARCSCYEGTGYFLLVTGNMRARNLFLEGFPKVVVRGDLTVTHGVQGHQGDDGGYLDVIGDTRAEIVVSTLYFNMSFGASPQAIVAADPWRTDGCEVDFSDDDLADALLPDLLDEDGSPCESLIEDALMAGRPLLRPDARPSQRSSSA